MQEWEKFVVGSPNRNPGYFHPDCMEFDTIAHTTHIDPAIQIIKNKKILPSLVFDTSILNDKRILVSWLSPNHWSIGFRYGNIKFSFSFADLIKNKKFYWIEAIAYGVPAPRILITDQENDHPFPIYDPSIKSGPWWFDPTTNKHYYNSNYCLEFMLEAPAMFNHLRNIDFVNHHKDYCSVCRTHPQACNELGFRNQKAGAYFLAQAITKGISLAGIPNLITDSCANNDIMNSVYYFLNRFSKVTFTGSTSTTDREPLMVAVMATFTPQLIDASLTIAKGFENHEEFSMYAEMAFAKLLGLREWQWPGGAQ